MNIQSKPKPCKKWQQQNPTDAIKDSCSFLFSGVLTMPKMCAKYKLISITTHISRHFGQVLLIFAFHVVLPIELFKIDDFTHTRCIQGLILVSNAHFIQSILYF